MWELEGRAPVFAQQDLHTPYEVVDVRHLREKLESRPEEPSLILTVPGQGYRFRET